MMVLMMMAIVFYVSTLNLDQSQQVTSVNDATANTQPVGVSALEAGNLKSENSQLKGEITSLNERIETLAAATESLGNNPAAAAPAAVDNSAEISTLNNQNAQLKQQLADAQKASISGGKGGGGTGSGDIVGRKVSGTAQDALKFTLQNGWGDSAVYVTKDQSYKGQLCLYQGNCNEHGENLLGKCFCLPGWGGEQCDQSVSKDPCTNKDDLCFYTEEAGVYAISLDRWHLAQEAELATWNANSDNNPDVGDRIEEHMKVSENERKRKRGILLRARAASDQLHLKELPSQTNFG